MVPEVKYYLVGGYIKEDTTRKDVDIIAVMSTRDFDLTFGFTHESLQQAYKERIRSERLKTYLMANKISGWVLGSLMGKKVDFKWAPPSMLYKPYVELHFELDLTMYL